MKFLRVNNTTCKASMLLLAVMLWCVASTSQASIQLPEQPQLDLEQLLAGSNSEEGSSSGASASQTSRDRLSDPLRDSAPADPSQLDFLHAYSSTSHGGSTSGTSSSGTSGGSNVSPLASLPTVNLSDAELVAWVASEQRFTLPMPPGNKLLRPPQV